MSAEFIIYRTFNYKPDATEMYEKLSQQGLKVELERVENELISDKHKVIGIFYIKLYKEDFLKADRVLFEELNASNLQLPADYYLFSFSDNELYDVLKRPDEWNELDRFWAQKLLKERGIDVNVEIIEPDRSKMAEAKKPWILNKYWLLIPLLFFLYCYRTLNFAASIGTILIGLYIWLGTKTMSNGEQVKAFSPTDRLLGRIVIIASGIVIISIILLKAFGYVPIDI
jgi:hypothetical protein